MPLLKRLTAMAMKLESTIGTAESLTAAEGAFNAYDLEIQLENDVEERECQGSFNYLAGVSGARGCTINFKVDLAMAGGTALPAWASVLFPCCGCEISSLVIAPKSEGLSASSSVHKTCTIGFYENGVFKSAAGCMGNFKIVANSGQIAYVEFEMKGVWQTVSDASLIDATYPQDLPMRFAGSGASAGVSLGGVSLCVSSLEFDLGNEVILRECPDTIAGYKSALVVSRYPKITIDPEHQLVANYDAFGKLLSNTEEAFSGMVGTGFTTGAQTNAPTCILAAPKAQIFSAQEGDREKLLTHELELMCNKNGQTEDEEFSLTFAAAS